MSDLKAITAMAQRQVELEDAVARAEEQLKSLKERLRIVSEVDLPQAMSDAELEDFTLSDGSKVTIKDMVVAGITEANRDAAHAWLRANNLGSLIKRDITLNFGKGEEADAEEALGIADRHGWRWKNKEAVHPSTLKAFIKEQLEQGSNLPFELFGARQLVRATITRAKQ
jgi:hypothetical protein